MAKISVLDNQITVQSREDADFISLTDIARYKDAQRTDDLIRNWLRNRNTVEFLGLWEQLNNPNFKPVEFDGFKMQAGLNSFTLTPKQWIESMPQPQRLAKLNAIAIHQMKLLTDDSGTRRFGKPT